jgi:hypothetical protein
MMAEQSLRDLLRQAAVKSYGEQRASELDKRLATIAHWLWLIDQEPLDLLDEEPDHGH